MIVLKEKLNKYNIIKLAIFKKVCYYSLYIILGVTLVTPLILIWVGLQNQPLINNGQLRCPNNINNKYYNNIKKYCKDSYISKVLSESKYPYTLAAIAKVESNYCPQIIGDSGASRGLYQIQPKHWGSFGSSVESQTKKAEQVLTELIKQHGYRKAIERYNGSGKKARQYAQEVRRIRRQIIGGNECQ